MKTPDYWYRKMYSYSYPERMNDIERDYILKIIKDIQNDAKSSTILGRIKKIILRP